jgi:ketosteroid isomerase-like protein
MQVPEWMTGLFQAIDRRDATAFSGYLSADARFVFGNAPAVCGRAEIEAAVGGFFAAIAGISHTLEDAWLVEGTAICRGTATYIRHDGSQITLPFANVLGLADGQIRDYRIYADTSPLFAV